MTGVQTCALPILTAIKVMEVIAGKKKELSELLKDLKIFPQKLVNIRVKDKQAALEDKDVLAVSEEIEASLGDNGRLLLRKSGTEPLIRVMAEAETLEQCEKYTDMVAGVLKKNGHTL